ncbi:hypothetical protein SAVIM338S_00358 [Streptomyces avidinii]
MDLHRGSPAEVDGPGRLTRPGEDGPAGHEHPVHRRAGPGHSPSQIFRYASR